MYHADGALVVGVLQVGVEQPQFFDQEHALVDDGAAGKAAHVGVGAGLLEHPARYVQPPVEGDARFQPRRLAHKTLPDAGHAGPGLVAQHLGAGGHLAPAQERQAFLFADDLKQLFGLVAAQFLLREKEHADAVLPLFPQFDAQGCGCFLKKTVADLRQDAYAVAGLALGILSGAVFQMLHDLQGILNGLVGLAALNVHNCADPAVVVLKAGIIQAGRDFAFGEILHALSLLLPKNTAASAANKKDVPAGYTAPAWERPCSCPYYTIDFPFLQAENERL